MGMSEYIEADSQPASGFVGFTDGTSSGYLQSWLGLETLQHSHTCVRWFDVRSTGSVDLASKLCSDWDESLLNRLRRIDPNCSSKKMLADASWQRASSTCLEIR